MREQDLEILRNIAKGKTQTYWPETHVRLRKKIKSGSKQIKLPNSRLCPKIIVLYDKTSGINNISKEDILNAMFGVERYQIFQDEITRQTLIRPAQFGGGRTTTATERNYLSAVARIAGHVDKSLSIDIFHNPYASSPLSLGCGEVIANQQFKLQHKPSNNYPDWIPIDSDTPYT